MARVGATIKKEFLQFKRDKLLVALILWTYTIEVVICAYALTFDVKNLDIAVYDQDRTQTSRILVERFTASEYFKEAKYVEGEQGVDSLLDAGAADMGIVIPPDFSARVAAGEDASVQLILSGTNSNTANAARAYAKFIIGGFQREAFTRYLTERGVGPELPEVEPRVRVWYNHELEFRYFMVISMIVMAGVIVGMIHIAATMVREKDTGTIEQLMVTPLERYELIFAKVVPTMTIGLASLFPSLLIALWFDLPMRGSIPLFFLASALFLFTSMGLGVYISTVSRNLQQALLISFFILFPMMFLSGTIVPVESMPLTLQRLSYLSPMRYYMEITLAIFLKGVGLKYLWKEFLIILAIGSVIFPLSLLRLRKRIYD